MNGTENARIKSNAAYGFASKARLKLGHLFVLAVLILAPAPHSLYVLLAGALLVVYGELMRIASAGQIRKNEELAGGGPYAYTRNPLYFGSLAMGAGVAIMSSHWAFFLAFVLLFFPLYYLTITGEESFLAAKFGERYEAYLTATPRLFPSATGYLPHTWFNGYDGNRMRGNREISTAITMAIVVLLFTIKWLLHLELGFW